MVREIIMPKLGETMEEGIIVKWLKAEGEAIDKGQPLLEVMTDKANFEVEAPASGVVRKILIGPSETPVPVKTVIGFVASGMDEPMPELKAPSPASPAAGTAAVPGAGGTSGSKVRNSSGVRASPRARKLAAEKGVDLTGVTGTGPGGRIVEKDVLDAATGGGAAPAPAGEALTGLRKIIAERMGAAKREIPHFYLSTGVDMTDLAAARPEGVSFNDIVIKAVAKALEGFPRLNARFVAGGLREVKEVNVATAVSLTEGLVAPVVKGANVKSLEEIAAVTKGFKEKAKTGRFPPADLEGGTITVSNLGMLGVDSFVAIVNPPQVCIVAVGRIRDAAVVVDGKIVAREMMTVTGSFDHRAVDGAYGARFLARLKEILERDHARL